MVTDDFEAIVAALLQVDPEGITRETQQGSKAKKKAVQDHLSREVERGVDRHTACGCS